MQHYFLNQPVTVGQTIEVPPMIQKHWLRVMRASVGTQAEFVDSNHQLFIGQLLLEHERPMVQIIKHRLFNPELPFSVTVACGVAKNDKADLVVRKATELGVAQIIFFAGEWSVAKWSANRVAKKLARLNAIALSAAEQSHRNLVPIVKYQADLKSIVAAQYDQKIVAYEEAAKDGEKAMLHQTIDRMASGASLLAIFGPEGGISPQEIQLLDAFRVQQVGLGPRILRTETAPLYLMAAISAFTELS